MVEGDGTALSRVSSSPRPKKPRVFGCEVEMKLQANPCVEATADSAMDLLLEFLVCVSHSPAVPHALR